VAPLFYTSAARNFILDQHSTADQRETADHFHRHSTNQSALFIPGTIMYYILLICLPET